ncbi:MAG: putative hydrolase of the HAD superfamily [Bacteroidetes bacterium]|nr:MAG: putative hydrolase of the HAD superfamily [Bacteroidota bacterium]
MIQTIVFQNLKARIWRLLANFVKNHAMIKVLVFDWGDTVMLDFGFQGPMANWPKVAWVPGAQKLLEVVYLKYRCVIATSADHSDVNNIRMALRRVGAEQYFHHFYSQIELGFKKPEPRFFSEVLRLSGFEPHESMMIGNLYDKDIIGAKEIGMVTVLFNEQSVSGSFPLADYVIQNFSQLEKILLK